MMASDEFVDVILGKLVEALRPGLYDQLEEATLNAALATIDSMQPRLSFRPFWRCRSLRLVLPAYDFFDRAIAT